MGDFSEPVQPDPICVNCGAPAVDEYTCEDGPLCCDCHNSGPLCSHCDGTGERYEQPCSRCHGRGTLQSPAERDAREARECAAEEAAELREDR